ncbi:hypothetical protein Tco_0214164 [Tanacetum coccineum]
MTVDDLLQVVPQLMSRIDSLETDLKQTKLTMGSAIMKLVKKVKKLEGILKRRNVVLSDFEEEEPEGEDQVGRRYKRRKESKGKKVATSLDFQEEVNTGSTKKSIPSPDKGQREGKSPMIIEEAPKKSKEQILQEEASLVEAIRLDILQKEEEAKQVHLDSLLAQRLAEEEELSKQQKKRRAQVQFEAQHYTDEDWDLIREKIEANAELSKRKEQELEEISHDPITAENIYAELFEESGDMEVISAEEFKFYKLKRIDKLVKMVEFFCSPINCDALKIMSGKRIKLWQGKGLHTDCYMDDSEDSDVCSEQEDFVSGTKIHVNHVNVAMELPSIATYKDYQAREKKVVYQIIREDGTDIVYINFGAMLKDISRDDLTELYRIFMNIYSMDGPED